MIKVSFTKKTFNFKRPSGTSRGILTEKQSWFLHVWNNEAPNIIGIGECSVIPGLSPDFSSTVAYEEKLTATCLNIDTDLTQWPSILFGLETALMDLKNGGTGIIFNNDFAVGKQKIPINGLIWMGDVDFMLQQIDEKIEEGFSTLKMKIGAINFDSEIKILHSIRKKYSKEEITLRVDANGAFSFDTALDRLTILAELDIHSIEQPIKAGKWSEMHHLCMKSPLKIALDEELIGIYNSENKKRLLETIQPSFIILKPSLHGGIAGCQEWIKLAEMQNIDWWITSALESNIGLNAICQFVAEYDIHLPQGLGTGGLYTNNISSNLYVEQGMISIVNAQS